MCLLAKYTPFLGPDSLQHATTWLSSIPFVPFSLSLFRIAQYVSDYLSHPIKKPEPNICVYKIDITNPLFHFLAAKMASPIPRQIFSLLTYLTIIQISFGTPYSAKKVSVDLYYESLCPYSADFIINDLATIFQNGIIDIVDLRLYPWGNAKLTSNNSFTCQHGPNECLLNTVEACAIHAWPNLDVHFPFISCVESLVYERKYYQWETCFKELSLDPKPVTDCYKGEEGKKLDLKYAALTAALKPPHEYVPWVVVDGQPLLEDFENLISYICKAYKGPQPSACIEASFASILRKKTIHVHPVSYTEQTTKAPFLMTIRSFVTSWVDQMMI